MTIPTFPTLIGLSWPVGRAPKWNTLKQQPISGKETRLQLWASPLYQFTLTFEYLSLADWQNLSGFYNSLGGAAQMFQFKDVNDDAVTNQQFGTGDGSTTAFQLVRALGGFVEPVFLPTGSITIKDNGTTVSGANYAIGAAGLVTFVTAPTAGHSLTWTGGFNWLCWFDDDLMDFSEFMSLYWELKKTMFTSVKL